MRLEINEIKNRIKNAKNCFFENLTKGNVLYTQAVK